MHRHIVLFNFKDDTAPEVREQVMTAIAKLGTLPTVKGFLSGKNILPGNPEKIPYEYLMMSDFADNDGRQAYEKHEIHEHVIRKDWLPVAKNYAVFDINF
jgi:hypothetical protein